MSKSTVVPAAATVPAPETIRAPALNILAPDFAPVGPDAMAAQARSWFAETPVGIAVLRYRQAREVMRDHRFAQSTTVYHGMQGVTEGPFVDFWQSALVGSEDEQHDRLTRLVGPAFRPHRMEGMRSACRRAIESMLDRLDQLDGQSGIDFVAELSDSYPMVVLSELLQVPHEIRAEVQDWSATLAHGFGVEVAQHLAEVNEATIHLNGVMEELIAHRRAHPNESLISDLIMARDGTDRLTDDELRSMLLGLLFGGHDTARKQLASGVLLLMQLPDEWERLAHHPELAAGAVEETVRLAPSVPMVARTPKRDLEYEGVPLTVGTFVGVLVATANRDPAIFGEDASTFRMDVSRPPSIGFGGGIHTCLGYALARIELQEALRALTRRYETPEQAGPAQWRSPLGISGPTSLPVRLRRRGG